MELVAHGSDSKDNNRNDLNPSDLKDNNFFHHKILNFWETKNAQNQ